MSTRCSIKYERDYERDEVTGHGIHLFHDLEDEPHRVLLELEGFRFQASVSVTPSGRHESRVQIRIPNRWARTLGLIAPLGGAEAGRS